HTEEYSIPPGTEVFEVNGPMFFGAAYKFKEALRITERPCKVLIIRMKNVPVIDATGIRVLQEINNEMQSKGTKLILTEINNEEVFTELSKARIIFRVGKANIKNTLPEAIERSKKLMQEAIHK